MKPLNVLTWHVHGSYLHYLSHLPHTLWLPTKPGAPEGYGGRAPGRPWPDNVVDVPADEVAKHDFDVILYQSRRNYLEDQYDILTPAQRRLPRIYVEHDPPRETPTDTRHPVDDPNVLLVHVTPFNRLMWDSGSTPTRVIDHGVVVPSNVRYSGEIERGVVVVNGLATRGRRLGLDVFEEVRRHVPLDLVGMGSERLGGHGELPHAELARFVAQRRFFFNPIRYTSLGLAVCEAMMIGTPVVGLATTEMVTAIKNGVSGYVDTRVEVLVQHMQRLLANPDEAARLGDGARRTARRRFAIERFVDDWNAALREAAARHHAPQRRGAAHA